MVFSIDTSRLLGTIVVCAAGVLAVGHGGDDTTPADAVFARTQYTMNPARQHTLPFKDFRQPLVPLHVGTPAQPLNAMLDLGFKDLLVASTELDEMDRDRTEHRFDASKSSSYADSDQRDILQHYQGALSLSSKVVQDTVTLGGVEVKEQAFGSIQSIGSTFLAPEGFDAILGLDTPRTSSAEVAEEELQKPTLWKNLIDRKLLDRNVMSLKFGRDEEEPGELAFGSVDPKYSDALIRMPISNISDSVGGHDSVGSFWHVSASSLQFGHLHEELNGFHLTFDTTSAHAMLPYSLAARIVEVLGIELDVFIPIDCARIPSLPDLTIALGPDKVPFTFSASEYIYKRSWDEDDVTRCFLAIDVADEETVGDVAPPTISLGTAFLRALYTVFDLDTSTISVAPIQRSS